MDASSKEGTGFVGDCFGKVDGESIGPIAVALGVVALAFVPLLNAKSYALHARLQSLLFALRVLPTSGKLLP